VSKRGLTAPTALLSRRDLGGMLAAAVLAGIQRPVIHWLSNDPIPVGHIHYNFDGMRRSWINYDSQGNYAECVIWRGKDMVGQPWTSAMHLRFRNGGREDNGQS
jgi:hypothetical protein